MKSNSSIVDKYFINGNFDPLLFKNDSFQQTWLRAIQDTLKLDHILKKITDKEYINYQSQIDEYIRQNLPSTSRQNLSLTVVDKYFINGNLDTLLFKNDSFSMQQTWLRAIQETLKLDHMLKKITEKDYINYQSQIDNYIRQNLPSE